MSGKFVGTICLRLEGNQQASIGCAFSRASQGDKLSYEAALALADFGFSELGIHRIYAKTISRNLPAIKLCKSLGMRQEAHFREHRFFKGQWWDTVIWQSFELNGKTQQNLKNGFLFINESFQK
ncbi:hypothetical protein IFVP18_C150598 [Vibrio parahaemolyticus]